MKNYNTSSTIQVTGQIKDVKFTDGGDKSSRMNFSLGKKQYRGKENPAEWVNYSVTVFGKTAELLNEDQDFGDGCICSVSGDHDQAKRESDDGRTFVYNNIATNDCTIVLGLRKAIAVGIVRDAEPAAADHDDREDFPID